MYMYMYSNWLQYTSGYDNIIEHGIIKLYTNQSFIFNNLTFNEMNLVLYSLGHRLHLQSQACDYNGYLINNYLVSGNVQPTLELVWCNVRLRFTNIGFHPGFFSGGNCLHDLWPEGQRSYKHQLKFFFSTSLPNCDRVSVTIKLM